MKLLQGLMWVVLLGLGTTPAWSQSYFQGWDGPNAESGNPVPGGNIFGADVISSGILNNGMYIMINDSPPTGNFFVGGYFQRFDLTKVSRVGFGLLQNVPDGGLANFPDGTDLGWKFDNLTVAAIPEPGSWAMTLVGLAGLAGFLRRRK